MRPHAAILLPPLLVPTFLGADAGLRTGRCSFKNASAGRSILFFSFSSSLSFLGPFPPRHARNTIQGKKRAEVLNLAFSSPSFLFPLPLRQKLRNMREAVSTTSNLFPFFLPFCPFSSCTGRTLLTSSMSLPLPSLSFSPFFSSPSPTI